MKKAQLSNLQGIIISLVVIGIVLGVGFYVLQEFRSNVVTGEGSVAANETLTAVTEEGETVAKTTEPGFSLSTGSLLCYNSTDDELISSGNYTATSAGIVAFASGGDIGFNDSDWLCTYSYIYGEEAWEGVNETITATLKIPGWLTIIVIIAIVGIILAILFGIFPRFGVGAEGGKGFGRISFGKGGSEGTAEI